MKDNNRRQNTGYQISGSYKLSLKKSTFKQNIDSKHKIQTLMCVDFIEGYFISQIVIHIVNNEVQ